MKRLLSLCGYEISKRGKKSRFENVLVSDLHPCTYRYYHPRADNIFELETEKGRPGHYFIWRNPDIFEYAVTEALKVTEGESKAVIMNVLRDSMALPENGAQSVGLQYADAPVLGKEPGWLYFLPWETVSVEKRKKKLIANSRKENRIHGLDSSLEGEGCWGSDKKARVEAARLDELLRSIKKYGIKKDPGKDGVIRANICIGNEGEWVWLIRAGNHRFSVAKALGLKTVPVRVMNWIFRGEAEYWPGVVSGVYSKEAALKVFDQLFENYSK